jgi:dTDP-4-amino-4,6-dideoxygalactose transaminase
MGPEVVQLEDELKAYVGVKHAIACASGTDALLMALLAEGVGPGDAIFTSPFTFIATAEVISLVGATPIFVDIDEKTYNIDPAWAWIFLGCRLTMSASMLLPNNRVCSLSKMRPSLSGAR